MKTKDLILWGFRPAHGTEPIKLEVYSAAAMKRRSAEGWVCAAYAQGVEPKGLSEALEKAIASERDPAIKALRGLFDALRDHAEEKEWTLPRRLQMAMDAAGEVL